MYLSLAVIWQPTLAQCYLCKKPRSHWRGLFLLHDPPELSRLFGSGCPCPSEKLSLWNWREWIIRDPLRLDGEPWRVSDPLINHLIGCTRQRTAIMAEVQANNIRVQQLAKDQGWKVAQNLAAGVGGLVIWPLWFAMDFQGTASTEASALQSRQQYLGALGSGLID